ncbi:glycoside hydrolase family 43 protein [Paenibacillus sp. UNC451MF]|uniref:glycoside hydrolase family 43 protein n=1 Tax=Paenibacillus sp. UNC451MF TaxID=1449063 RepID=UPI00048B8D82|nr:glycoside hydrolase family 43 protein [Paenibacillus sp. UNC451MF]
MKRLDDIHLRDPFILPVESERKYYLYGTSGETAWTGKPQGFDVYISDDLVNWEGPHRAFRPDASFWADRHYWAPEVHEWKGSYYMFASFKSEDRCRATQILVADRPEGPFKPHGNGPVTPADWECLDGTLYVDRSGEPWIVFCHEWLQVKDGEVCALRLSSDLTETQGDVITLFKASDAPWVRPVREGDTFVTDGPFFYSSKTGELLLLWSSFGEQGYAMGIARSLNGDISGPWIHEAEPVYRKDGGHGMLFHGLLGGLMLTIHLPNKNPNERPHIFPVEDCGGTLSVGAPIV